MEKLLMGGVAPVLVLAGLVAIVAVGIMSILLPILVFRILSKVSKMNENMNKIVISLHEVASATREPHNQRQPDDIRRGSLGARSNDPMDIGQKSLRFK